MYKRLLYKEAKKACLPPCPFIKYESKFRVLEKNLGFSVFFSKVLKNCHALRGVNDDSLVANRLILVVHFLFILKNWR